MIRTFQKVNMAIKYASRPVVVAPFGLTLGGGCEMCLHATVIQVAAEAYMGLWNWELDSFLQAEERRKCFSEV